MNQLLTTTGCLHQIENIIKSAQQYLCLISPFFRLESNLYSRIKEANDRGVEIYVVFGKEDMLKDAKEFFTGLDLTSVYYCKELHAKLIMNETSGLLTSMNLYVSSNRDYNRELGISFTAGEDDNIFQDCKTEIKSIISSSKILKKRKAKSVVSAYPLELNLDIPIFAEINQDNYHLPDLFLELKRRFSQYPIFWQEEEIILKFSETYSLLYSYRIKVPFDRDNQLSKAILGQKLARTNINARFFANSGNSLTVYRSIYDNDFMHEQAKESIITAFILSTEVILNHLNESVVQPKKSS